MMILTAYGETAAGNASGGLSVSGKTAKWVPLRRIKFRSELTERDLSGEAFMFFGQIQSPCPDFSGE